MNVSNLVGKTIILMNQEIASHVNLDVQNVNRIKKICFVQNAI